MTKDDLTIPCKLVTDGTDGKIQYKLLLPDLIPNKDITIKQGITITYNKDGEAIIHIDSNPPIIRQPPS